MQGADLSGGGSCKYIQISPPLMLGVLIHCWVQLAGVSGGEKTYSGSSIIIIIYPALSLAIGRRDRVDGSRGHWMMHSNYRTCHQT